MIKKILCMIILFFVLLCNIANAFDDVRQNSAQQLMAECEKILYHERQLRYPNYDERFDPEHSGLIGPEFTPLVTTLGHWRDKVISSRPQMAGVVAGYLLRAGLKSGDLVAVNASSSYPGFVIASLCAIQTLGLRATIICSYGSSMYGATMPNFTLPVMLDCLKDAGLINQSISALSPGGFGDEMGEVLLEDGRPIVKSLMANRSERLLTGNFEENLSARCEIFFNDEMPGVLISCGGPGSSLSPDDDVFLPHGLIRPDYQASPNRRGVIFECFARGIPVIHLLYVRGICNDFELPYEEMKEPE